MCLIAQLTKFKENLMLSQSFFLPAQMVRGASEVDKKFLRLNFTGSSLWSFITLNAHVNVIYTGWYNQRKSSISQNYSKSTWY